MKRLLVIGAFALLALASWDASAAKILRQNADGTASWVNTRDNSETAAGEHAYTVVLDDITTASTTYVAIPNGGRLKEVIGIVYGRIATATGEIQFYIASPATAGGKFNQFTPVTPLVSEAASGQYQLQIPLAYNTTGQVVTRVWPVNSNTSLNFDDDDVLAIHTDGEAAQAGETAVGLTIIVH